MKSKILQRLLDETPKELKIFVDKYTDLVIRINQILNEKGINQRELAIKLDKQPSEISKWLSGDHNFTLRSISKLEAELGESLLEVPKKNEQIHFVEGGYVKSFNLFINTNTKSEVLSKVIIWNPIVELPKLGKNVG